MPAGHGVSPSSSAKRLAEFRERFAKTAPKAVACLEAVFEDAMAVMALPEKYRRRLRASGSSSA